MVEANREFTGGMRDYGLYLMLALDYQVSDRSQYVAVILLLIASSKNFIYPVISAGDKVTWLVLLATSLCSLPEFTDRTTSDAEPSH